MVDYKELYSILFNAITDALEQPSHENYGLAKDLLIAAQQKTEELYIASEEENPLACSSRQGGYTYCRFARQWKQFCVL